MFLNFLTQHFHISNFGISRHLGFRKLRIRLSCFVNLGEIVPACFQQYLYAYAAINSFHVYLWSYGQDW